MKKLNKHLLALALVAMTVGACHNCDKENKQIAELKETNAQLQASLDSARANPFGLKSTAYHCAASASVDDPTGNPMKVALLTKLGLDPKTDHYASICVSDIIKLLSQSPEGENTMILVYPTWDDTPSPGVDKLGMLFKGGRVDETGKVVPSSDDYLASWCPNMCPK